MGVGEPEQGRVLLLVDDPERARNLVRWIGDCGEEAVVLSGREPLLLGRGEDDSIDLVVTQMDTDDPGVRVVLERLLDERLLSGVPKLHVIRDPAVHSIFRARGPAVASTAIAWPVDGEAFRSRVSLAAEVGRLRRELSRSSVRDQMTDLFNRRWVLRRLEEEFSRARRYRTPLSYLVLDVDHLRDVNDAHGEAVGDAVLRGVAKRLEGHVRREDVLGRCGEDSFGLLLPGNRCRGAAVLANKILAEIEEWSLGPGGPAVHVRLSAGISSFPASADVRSPDDLRRRTEAALARAKELGGGRVFIDEEVLRSERNAVLVLDADPVLRDLVAEVLAEEDLRVSKAACVEEAEAAVERGRPDLVVTEVEAFANLDELRGFLDCVARGAADRVPVIAMSRPPGLDHAETSRYGIDRFVTKPFSLSVLRALARELLDALPV